MRIIGRKRKGLISVFSRFVKFTFYRLQPRFMIPIISIFRQLTTEPAVVNSADEEVIDFMSDQPAPSPAVQAAPQRDVETAAALRHARLRQQTVSLILQDDPGESLH